jgi:hypothetical protein
MISQQMAPDNEIMTHDRQGSEPAERAECRF